MKKTLLILTLFFTSFGMTAQITLEHTYNDAGFFNPYQASTGNNYYSATPFYMVKLEDGEKYVLIDKQAQTMTFYSLDHTPWKSINYSNVTLITQNSETEKIDSYIFYISQHLFDLDDELEFMYNVWDYNGSGWVVTTEIVNEDGSILLSSNASPFGNPAIHNQFSPLYQTDNGLKMILSNPNGTAEVYSLPGTFSPEIAQNNILEQGQMRLFPNPSNAGGMINIHYELPPESTNAELSVCNSQGKQVKSYQISGENTNFQFNSNDLLKGTYFYTIRTPEGKTIASQKLIIIE